MEITWQQDDDDEEQPEVQSEQEGKNYVNKYKLDTDQSECSNLNELITAFRAFIHYTKYDR